MALSGLVLLALAPLAQAAPLSFHQTGRVLDASGDPLEGEHVVTATLYDELGAAVWSRSFSEVSFEAGYYAVVLGEDGSGRTLEQATTGPAPAVELGIRLDGASVDLTPRSPLGATPRAATADGATARAGVLNTPCPSTDGGLAYDPTNATITACVGGAWLPLMVDPSAASCAVIKQRNPAATTGPYAIDPDGFMGPVPAYDVQCDMTTDGGGWTKIITHAGGTDTSYFWGSSRWFESRTTAGSSTTNTDDFVSYAAFDVRADEVMFRRAGGAPIQRPLDAAHSGEPLTHWLSQITTGASAVLGPNLDLANVYTNPVGMFVTLSPAEADAYFGVAFGAEYVQQLRILAFDRSTSSDPWHMWHGTQANVLGSSAANGCAQLPSPWARRALHPNGVTDVCYASTTADYVTIWVR